MGKSGTWLGGVGPLAHSPGSQERRGSGRGDGARQISQHVIVEIWFDLNKAVHLIAHEFASQVRYCPTFGYQAGASDLLLHFLFFLSLHVCVRACVLTAHPGTQA